MKTEELKTIDETQLDGVAGGGLATTIGMAIDGAVDIWEAGLSDFFDRRGMDTLAALFKSRVGK